ncbi:MAG: hypothetical protein GX130_10235 [Candidatus Hydrogenedens sp.]|nr:hypothetical protein [Candidatus Hydrogenedens sp.]
MNQIQVIGTHNSYHIAPDEALMEACLSVDRRARQWQYTHDPLDIQFDKGVRSLELDIHPFLSGFKVFHVPVVDEGSHCPELKDCLATMLLWSLDHPEHVPITILFEFKMMESRLSGEAVRDDPVEILELFQEEIRAVIPQDKIIDPFRIHQGKGTLRQVLEEEGWPLLEDCLGKFIFILHDRQELRDASSSLTAPPLLFVNSSPDREDGAFIVVDDPYNEHIPLLLEKNMFVRVRADSGLRVNRPESRRRRDDALSCGAQIVSTDFPGSGAEKEGYQVAFSDGVPVRSNPVTGNSLVRSYLKSIVP